MKLIKLIPKENSLFHIGEKDLQSTETIIHSDTLFSAICNNYRLIYGKEALNELSDRLYSDKNLKLSSAFHYLEIYSEKESKGTILFLPKPFIKFGFTEEGKKLKDEEPKLFKKIEFISLNVLKRWNKSQLIDFSKKYILDTKYLIDEEDYTLLGLNLCNDKSLERAKQNIKLIKESEEQKVTIDRINNVSDTFYQSNFEFLESNYFIEYNHTKIEYTTKAGLYFLIKDDEIDKKLLAAIKIIQDQGIGGERSSGKGFFKNIEIIYSQEFEELNKSEQRQLMNLSLVFPEKSEIGNDKLESYSLIERKGFIYSEDGKSLRRKSVRMLKEGSVFNEKVVGKIVDVTPKDIFTEHNVYRNGLAFLVPINYEEKENDER